jgi:sugar lactone lactonase YvrE
VQVSSGPFNGVTNVAVLDDGEMFVSDGYGNARVHRFAADGTHITSWGTPGTGPGEFNLPHAVAVDGDGRVLVADRENSRIQLFNRDGVYLESWNWVNRPDDLFIDEHGTLYVAELGWTVPHRDVPHYRFMPHPPAGHPPIARVTVCDLEGAIKTQIGGFSSPLLPGNFIVPHGIWADSRGDLYVGEVVKASGAIEHFAPLTCHAFQKFVKSGT